MVSAHLKKAQKNKHKWKLRKLKCFHSTHTIEGQTPQKAETVPVNNTELWTGVDQHVSRAAAAWRTILEYVFYKHPAPVSLCHKNKQKKKKI